MTRRGFPWVGALAGLISIHFAALSSSDGDLAARALDFLQRERDKAGVPALERREELDRVAEARIRTLTVRPVPTAAQPELDRGGSLRSLLEAEAVGPYRSAYEYLDVRRGGTSGQAFARLWRSQPEAWRHAMDPEMDAIGLATIRTDQRWLVLVAVLLDRVDPRDASRIARRTLDEVNARRAGQGVPTLTWDEALARLAAERLDEEIPDLLAGVRGARRKAAMKARYRGPDDPVPRALEIWSRESLRAELMDPAYTRGAVGAVSDERGETRFVLLLVEPME